MARIKETRCPSPNTLARIKETRHPSPDLDGPTEMVRVNNHEATFPPNHSPDIQARITALETTLDILQAKQERFEYGLRMKRKRAELCGTEVFDEPEGDEARGPIFVYYAATEKEKRRRVAERYEKVKGRLETAKLRREDAEVMRLEERMAKLKWLWKTYGEEEAQDGRAEECRSGRDLTSGHVEKGKQMTMEDTLLFVIYERNAAPFWASIAVQIERAGGPSMLGTEAEQRFMDLSHLPSPY